MNKIIGILLVGLLGVLGCSDSNDGTSTFSGEAIPAAPFGIIDTPTPTYKWTPVPGATQYRLLVQDANETVVLEESYTAEESECSSEDGLCMATPDIEVYAKNTWMVQACLYQECTLWSKSLNFNVTVMNAPRFTDNGDGTVTDNKTKLMWTKNANPYGYDMDWVLAFNRCKELRVAGYSDWGLPWFEALYSLVDDKQNNPALPPDHPFTRVLQSPYSYWTAAYKSRFSCDKAAFISISDGGYGWDCTVIHHYAWCVRRCE